MLSPPGSQGKARCPRLVKPPEAPGWDKEETVSHEGKLLCSPGAALSEPPGFHPPLPIELESEGGNPTTVLEAP